MSTFLRTIKSNADTNRPRNMHARGTPDLTLTEPPSYISISQDIFFVRSYVARNGELFCFPARI